MYIQYIKRNSIYSGKIKKKERKKEKILLDGRQTSPRYTSKIMLLVYLVLLKVTASKYDNHIICGKKLVQLVQISSVLKW